MHGEIIQSRVIIVEDSEKIAKALKRNLNIVHKGEGYCLVPEYELVSSFAGFQRLVKQTPQEIEIHSSATIDINLGADKTMEGLEILEYILGNCSSTIHPLVYTAYPNIKTKCEGLGLDPDAFFIKHDGTLFEDFANIKHAIEKKFNAVKAVSIAQAQFSLLVSKSNVYKRQKYIGMNLGGIEFNPLNEAEQLLLFSFFAHPIKQGLNVFTLLNRNWQFAAIENLDTALSNSFLVQSIKIETNEVEGIYFKVNNKKIFINFIDLDTIEKSIDTIYHFVKNSDSFESRLVEFFLSNRLVELFTNEVTGIILKIVDRMVYSENRSAFIFGVWERIAASKDGNSGYESFLSHFDKMELLELYNGEVESIITDETGSPSLCSILRTIGENSTVTHRDFPSALMQRFGVSNINDRFMFIAFAEKAPYRETIAIVPLPPNINYKPG